MGDQGQGAASQLLRLPHPGLHHQGWQLQRGGDIRAVQEPPAHGNLILLLQSCLTQSKDACRTRHIPMVLVGVIQ